MAERAGEARGLNDVAAHVRTETEAIRADYARMRVAIDDIDALLAVYRGLPTGRAEEEAPDQPRDLAARGATCMEGVRDRLFKNEDRLVALETTVLTIVQEHAYANEGATAHGADTHKDESWHAPPMDDLHALEAETGVAGQDGPERKRVTVMFAYKPF
jgi:hypothetical protein